LGNDDPMGKLMMHSIVDLANGILLAVTKALGKFPCLLMEDREIRPYNLTFDDNPQKRAKLSHAQRELIDPENKKATANAPQKAWEKVVELDDSGCMDTEDDEESVTSLGSKSGSDEESEEYENIWNHLTDEYLEENLVTFDDDREGLIKALSDNVGEQIRIIEEILDEVAFGANYFGVIFFNDAIRIYLLARDSQNDFQDLCNKIQYSVDANPRKVSEITDKLENNILHMHFLLHEDVHKPKPIDVVVSNFQDPEIVKLGIEEYEVNIDDVIAHLTDEEREEFDDVLNQLGYEADSEDDNMNIDSEDHQTDEDTPMLGVDDEFSDSYD
jgi:hypothetical protein